MSIINCSDISKESVHEGKEMHLILNLPASQKTGFHPKVIVLKIPVRR
jgi:hypothetical protein